MADLKDSPADIWHDYGVYRVHSSASKLVICEKDALNTPIFFTTVYLSKGKDNHPDVALHAVQPNGLDFNASADGRKISAAEGTASPIMATAYFRNTSRNIGLAFGDPANSDSLHWEKMKQENISGSRYSFMLPSHNDFSGIRQFVGASSTSHFPTATDKSIPSPVPITTAIWRTRSAMIPMVLTSSRHDRPFNKPAKHITLTPNLSDEASSPLERPPTSSSSPPPPPYTPTHRPTSSHGRPLIWKRTHSAELLPSISTLSRRLSLSNRKLVDELTGEVLALFETGCIRGLRNVGVLRVRRDLVDGPAGGEVGVGTEDKRQHDDDEDNDVGAALVGIVLSLCVVEERIRREG